MNIELNPEEARVIGCLMEKAITTPDQYPLTLNALTNACNQKSSREPVMSLEQGIVQRTTRQLEDKYLVSTREGSRSVEKYSQRLCNTPLAQCQFNEGEYAVVCLLLLRGPQTPGELRARSGRLASFADNQDVVDTLASLMTREAGALVARLPRKPGRQDHEYMHLFSGEIESVAQEETIVQRPSAATASVSQDRLGKLEKRIDALENALISLAERLGEDIDFSSIDDDAS
jgi:uncharacterized protein